MATSTEYRTQPERVIEIIGEKIAELHSDRLFSDDFSKKRLGDLCALFGLQSWTEIKAHLLTSVVKLSVQNGWFLMMPSSVVSGMLLAGGMETPMGQTVNKYLSVLYLFFKYRDQQLHQSGVTVRRFGRLPEPWKDYLDYAALAAEEEQTLLFTYPTDHRYYVMLRIALELKELRPAILDVISSHGLDPASDNPSYR
jgi:hypothetical protein